MKPKNFSAVFTHYYEQQGQEKQTEQVVPQAAATTALPTRELS